jgi:hypothetical protein
MRIQFPVLLFAAAIASAANASSLRLSGLIDGDEGHAVDVDAMLALTGQWSVGAGAGRSHSAPDAEGLSATSLRISTDLQVGGVFANAAAEQWKDSGELRATTLRGSLGWMSDAGFAVSALVADRDLDITYTATVQGVTRELQIDIDATGLGAELSWFGTRWSAGASFMRYDYGRNVDRIRAILDAAATERFPRLQRLATSVAARAAGAPDREISLLLAREFPRGYVSADWLWQRDAVMREKANMLAATLGWYVGPRWRLDTTAGVSRSDSSGSVPFGGLSITLRSAR